MNEEMERKTKKIKIKEEENDDGGGGGEKKRVEEKQKPNFKLSGKLAEDTNTFNGVVVKYNEPPEARAPKRKWRLYPFKGDHLNARSIVH